jgi:hypothetical protein
MLASATNPNDVDDPGMQIGHDDECGLFGLFPLPIGTLKIDRSCVHKKQVRQVTIILIDHFDSFFFTDPDEVQFVLYGDH